MPNLPKTRALFAWTSPRTVQKIIPEINLLIRQFGGQTWSKETQAGFYTELAKCDFFESDEKPPKEADFAGRERITRAPQMLGFVDLKPAIRLTNAGRALLESPFTAEVLTKQLLKFQFPNPYYTFPKSGYFADRSRVFHVRPYLELLRLIAHVGSLSKTEIALFFPQMTQISRFPHIVSMIERFRAGKKDKTVSYRTYVHECFRTEILKVYEDQIADKELKTRESTDDSLNKFIATKKSNLNDYADAFIRYLRATELITFDKRTFHVIISPDKQEEVDFILRHVPREPVPYRTKEDFQTYLFSSTNIKLLRDDPAYLSARLNTLRIRHDLTRQSVDQLKSLLLESEAQVIEQARQDTIRDVKNFNNLEDVREVFGKIVRRDVPDAPLYLEWNVWRAMEMLGCAVSVNNHFKMGTDGLPTCAAPGNTPDIDVEYDDFKLILEVTTSGGATQHKMETDSIPRHIGLARDKSKKPVYCLFIAVNLNPDTAGHFRITNFHSSDLARGKTDIVPLNLQQFMTFLETAKDKSFNDAGRLRRFLEELIEDGRKAPGERAWLDIIAQKIPHWLN